MKVFTVYINWRGPAGRETIDQVDQDEKYFTSRAAVRREARRLLGEYALCGMAGAYLSSRSCANWS
jgi:hypothetical protein